MLRSFCAGGVASVCVRAGGRAQWDVQEDALTVGEGRRRGDSANDLHVCGVREVGAPEADAERARCRRVGLEDGAEGLRLLIGHLRLGAINGQGHVSEGRRARVLKPSKQTRGACAGTYAQHACTHASPHPSVYAACAASESKADRHRHLCARAYAIDHMERQTNIRGWAREQATAVMPARSRVFLGP